VKQSSRRSQLSWSLRRATIEDLPALRALIAESARVLCARDYTPAQIEAALGTAWGVDTELIRDGTYFVAEVDSQIVGCGGWSRRATLFGGDDLPGRQSELLDPACDAVRVRAFFVRPGWDRRGIGRALLERCEAEARADGFSAAELVATLPGQRLYKALGYSGNDKVEYPLAGGLTIAFVPMRKQLA
jgi:N-acetylglutamate synthase-like GNAT family acetyltransferase